MARFLSPEWLAELDAAAGASVAPRHATTHVAIVVEHHVTDGPDGPVVYHVAIDHGSVRVRPGPAPAPTVRFTQSWDTAVAIAQGRVGAQAAFIAGRLRLGGDTRALLENQGALAGLDHLFAAVRPTTTW